MVPDFPPRLFLCSNASGKFEVEEIFNFTQQDMEDDDIMLLDTHDTICLWVGKDANVLEKKESYQTALVCPFTYNYIMCKLKDFQYYLLLTGSHI